VLLLKKRFDNQPLQYAQFDMTAHVSDFEFFDEKELALLIQIDTGKKREFLNKHSSVF
jgi:hypothetical protein